MNFYRLKNTVRDYDWGSKSMMSHMLGIENPEKKTIAEIWLGAHPLSPSAVIDGSEEITLDKFIEKNPETVLGQKTVEKFNSTLPFLMKILAVEKPLSIQVHPDKIQALKGYERENAEGLAIDSPLRCYRDLNHKPETICALTPFTILCGFRKAGEIYEIFKLATPVNLRSELELLKQRDIRGFVERLLKFDKIRAKLLLNEFKAAASSRMSTRSEAFPLCMELLSLFPNDVSALMPALLHIVTLEPGMALNIPSGELHAYISGLGIELMASSDNVIRCGLTTKAVNIPEFLNIAKFESAEFTPVAPVSASAGISIYESGAEEFLLTEIKPEGSALVTPEKTVSAKILFCVEGEAELNFADNVSCALKSGESLLIPANAPSYSVSGECRVFAASVPV